MTRIYKQQKIMAAPPCPDLALADFGVKEVKFFIQPPSDSHNATKLIGKRI